MGYIINWWMGNAICNLAFFDYLVLSSRWAGTSAYGILLGNIWSIPYKRDSRPHTVLEAQAWENDILGEAGWVVVGECSPVVPLVFLGGSLWRCCWRPSVVAVVGHIPVLLGSRQLTPRLQWRCNWWYGCLLDILLRISGKIALGDTVMEWWGIPFHLWSLFS